MSNNKTLTSIFKMLQQQKMHNALIFYGNAGVGKYNFAYNLSKFMLSHTIQDFSKQSMDFFNLENTEHSVVNLMQKHVHDGFLVLDDTSNTKSKTSTISVENIRSLSNFLQTSNANYYKIIIINTIDLLNINASNALLKMLEDTPKNVVFLLICNNYNQVLDTIKSRCIAFYFPPLTTSQLNDYVLEHNLNIEDKHLPAILKLSSGSYTKLQWFSNAENLNLYKSIIYAINSGSHFKILQLKKSIEACNNINIIFDILENFLYSKTTTANVHQVDKLMQQWLQTKKLYFAIYLDAFAIISQFIFNIIAIQHNKQV